MTDEAFVRQRRCLNIISIALIAYFAVGIEFGPDGLAGVSIRDGVIAGAFVWIAFFYFWWRFHLFGAEVQRTWQLDFLFELSKNEKYRRFYAQPEEEGENQAGQTVWAPSLHGQGFRRHLSWEEAYLVGVRDEQGKIQFAEQSTFSHSINPATQRWNVGAHTVIPLKWHKYAMPALKANVKAMNNASGTEWALPNFLACIALICGVAALITKFI